jgi:4-hydroxybenzoyl-CoA thioesterase
MSEVFVREKRVRFHHCDPAGIVFYPQYFVLFHELMEDWFREGLGLAHLHGARRVVAEGLEGLATEHQIRVLVISGQGEKSMIEIDKDTTVATC